MSAASITLNGRTVELSDIEISQGRRQLSRRLRELRQACPGLKILDDLTPCPIQVVEVSSLGVRTPVLVDPLRILDRCGVKAGIPHALQQRIDELELTDDWA